jgi:hypothetical protein
MSTETQSTAYLLVSGKGLRASGVYHANTFALHSLFRRLETPPCVAYPPQW